MGEVVNIWDFKRKEEREAELARFAKRVVTILDTAPCEMPPVQPMYEAPDQDGA